ncbi:shikimate dehydrogenase [Parvibium lacunae]|uniref:Shikimate dehydrogenase (NADP(+)) n=1 Tax=Parvibium lacunae TaxID=1888893 RepID=A0A368KZI5_9BURK|nr:shikimate dehydrogenase [Parvibium lacunae]RCS56727.1 shikimate dehydrogenase [Parvibium lacunae]
MFLAPFAPFTQDTYAVIGHPIAHSQSPAIHAAFAAQTGQALVYEKLLAPLTAFSATAEAFRQAGGRGLNVTVPFKLEACHYATILSERAQQAGAVNTLMFFADGRIYGDNTDGAGLIRDLQVRWQTPLAGQRILLLGAGGAARGALWPLLATQPACLHIANRTIANAEALVAPLLGQTSIALSVSGFEAIPGSYDVVINASASSLAATAPVLPEGVYAPGALAYDMMYGATPTAFIQAAQASGAQQAVDGLGMLVEQAAEAFALWRGVRPATDAVYQARRAALG